MYHEATEAVSLSEGVRRRECQITDYDGRSPMDRLSDAGSIPARSTTTLTVESVLADISDVSSNTF